MRAFTQRIVDKPGLRHAFERAYRHAQLALQTGEAYEVVVRLATKSREQECHYHALIADIADQHQHCGRKWNDEDMKRLLVDAFKHDTKDDPDYAHLWREMGELQLAPAIGRDGFVVLGDQTRKFPVKLAGAFITWLQAFMADNEIATSDPKYQAYAVAA